MLKRSSSVGYYHALFYETCMLCRLSYMHLIRHLCSVGYYGGPYGYYGPFEGEPFGPFGPFEGQGPFLGGNNPFTGGMLSPRICWPYWCLEGRREAREEASVLNSLNVVHVLSGSFVSVWLSFSVAPILFSLFFSPLFFSLLFTLFLSFFSVPFWGPMANYCTIDVCL